ncbi:tRNA dihydrouridine(20/20a) synthase DusA [Alcanivorax jadensis]|uniref:tRNA dihydrouridine(20/20a) synthase DusA n=1 Tax=Alcanivorax jadensis TaxID=64988 RepID=UPI0026F0FFE2|nr:tRNA dihydrouridine(20/20a) synthase DusA [Alcanivorax jadensis]
MNDSLIQTTPSLQPDRRLSVAPMMDWTTRDYRFLARLITRHTLLYTEMVVAQAILRGDRDRFLAFNDEEHPVALQLGGCEPQDLAEAARIAEQYGYDEINLNVGCPSDRVQQGKIGAILMAEPELVGQCVEAMQAAVSVPVTVKTRIGIDDQDDYDFLYRFVTRMEQAGCTSLTIHARKAILSGLSPKENREIPPLIYQRAYAIKQAFPHMEIVLNGGIKTLEEVHEHMGEVDGVMIGREAYQNPYFLADADRIVFADDHPVPSRREVAEQFLPYVERRYALGHAPKHSLRHILNLFQGEPGARRFRRHLSENMHKPDTTPQVLMDALAQLS